ncbi:FAD-binding oxidoreductase [Candidatus Curtissbacteria bacterium]|nr:FAD-binding oxidoreductase [Candidatus Curtissbacteria bacterium]
MDIKLVEQLKKSIEGDVATDEETLATFSHDASIFEVKPQIVVFPKNSNDVKNLVKFVLVHKNGHPDLSLTARSAGTDMAGGPLNNSIIVSFQKYFNHIGPIKNGIAVAEPGVFYRDFEDATLAHDLIFPAYPASREICAIGGIVNNNSGGEKSLQYGKTEKYVVSLKVVLADGNEHILEPLDKIQLQNKLQKKNFEGEVYQKIYQLIKENYQTLQKAKPQVSKNSAGYSLWDVYDKNKNIFDLTKLFVGAQGTLGLVTEATFKLIPTKRFSEMIIIFLNNLDHLGEIINDVLPLEPESFETYDDHTLKLAIKFFPEFAKKLGTKNFILTGWHFLPEFWLMLSGGIPKLVLQVEFAGDERKILTEKITRLRENLKPYNLKSRIAPTKKAQKKYWLIRRESFNLLRHKIKDKHATPFIDDFAVKPKYLTEFLPKLNKIFAKYPHLIYTIAGHLGDGNFHIIPLMNIEDPKQQLIIPKLSEEVYNLVLDYKGTTTAEHNDGLIRSPFLSKMYGHKIYDLFAETKKIFDPQGIFNPRKKVGADLDFAMKHIRLHW